jgi:hypothetical protein
MSEDVVLYCCVCCVHTRFADVSAFIFDSADFSSGLVAWLGFVLSTSALPPAGRSAPDDGAP